MIKVVELTCTEDLHLNRRGTFTAGKTYYSKISKSGQNIIALSNEGKWQPVRSLKMSSGSDTLRKHFYDGCYRFFTNKTELRDFVNTRNNSLEKKWSDLAQKVYEKDVYVKDIQGNIHCLEDDIDMFLVIGKSENLYKYTLLTQEEIDRHLANEHRLGIENVLRSMELNNISMEELIDYHESLEVN